MIRFSDVSFTYPSGYRALNNINLEIDSGEWVTLHGKPGSGKTTLLMLITGLLSATTGHIVVLDKTLAKLSHTELAKLRRKMGLIARWVPLIDHVSALENLIQPLLIGGMNQHAAEKKGKHMLGEVNLGHRYRDDITTFSESEVTKLLLARALIHEPSIILLDDALGDIDEMTGQLMDTLLKERHQQGATLVQCQPYSSLHTKSQHRAIELMDSQLTEDSEHLLIDIAP